MSMRVQIAQALYSRNAASLIQPWDAMHEPGQASWLANADAALAALRTPTKAMLKAGESGNTLIEAWQLMIEGAGK